MTYRHIVVAKTADGDAWFTALDGHILSVGVASAEGVVKAALKMLHADPTADFSFTERRATQLLDDPLVEDPAKLLHAAPGTSVELFAPEGRPGDDSMWATAWRNPLGGLSSAGIQTRFREQSLVDRVTAWFERERWQSFRPEAPSEAHSIQRINRPHFAREVLVRRGEGWRIRDLCPEAFAPPGAAFAAAR
jgi:hypothetical protein